MRTPTRNSRYVDGVPTGYNIWLEPSTPEIVAYRRDSERFDRIARLFRELGFCAAMSPDGRACSRHADHFDENHWAESPKFTIVEVWTGGELVDDEAIAS